MRKTVLAMVAALALPCVAPAQQQARRPMSPAGSAQTQVGGKWSDGRYTDGKWIEIDYGRPIRRGRENLFGSGADYGKKISDDVAVWRLGANATTRLKTEVALTMGGKKLEPGTYSLFVELKESGWTLVVSKQPAQEKYDNAEKVATWGAYNYDPKYDVARVPMKMMKPAVDVDQLTIGFVDMSDKGGKIAIAWGNQGAVAEFSVAQ